MKKSLNHKNNLIVALKQGAKSPWVKDWSNLLKIRKGDIQVRKLKKEGVRKTLHLKGRVKFFNKITTIHKSKIKAHRLLTKFVRFKKRQYFIRVKRSRNIFLVNNEYLRYAVLPKLEQRRKIAQKLFAEKKIFREFQSIEDTHNQGAFRWDGKLITLLSHLNPTNKIKRKWTNYLSHLHLLALKRPFRFDHSILLNYRLVGKLMTYYFNKGENAYDVYYDVGTHERVHLSTKDMWWTDEKLLYTNLPFDRRWNVVIYNSYSCTHELEVSPIDTFHRNANGFNLNYHFDSAWQFDPLYDLYRIKNDFFRPLKGSIYQLDKMANYYGPSSNMYSLTAPHSFKTFFMSSFFKSKEIEHPYKFFTWFNEEFNSFITTTVQKDSQIIILKECSFTHKNYFLRSMKIYMFLRAVFRAKNFHKALCLSDMVFPKKTKRNLFKPAFGKVKLYPAFRSNLNYLNHFLVLNINLPSVLDAINWSYLRARRSFKRKTIILLSKKLI